MSAEARPDPLDVEHEIRRARHRPPDLGPGQTRVAQVRVRVTRDELGVAWQRAKRSGEPFADWVRRRLVRDPE